MLGSVRFAVVDAVNVIADTDELELSDTREELDAGTPVEKLVDLFLGRGCQLVSFITRFGRRDELVEGEYSSDGCIHFGWDLHKAEAALPVIEELDAEELGVVEEDEIDSTGVE